MPRNLKTPQTKEQRLAAALRANLKRRKDAARAAPRPVPPPAGEPVSPGPNTAEKPD